ncbi:AAA domain-containing protein [Actinoplanes sp. G11-F43]|uniref:AAA domain-containing protein n=1 Tax=Actinoplanes sp. G11-F43 TaxID=3424130 RepID=UPI003D32AF0B
MTSLSHDEAPATIRSRTAALAAYLLAVRAQMEKPSRTVPTTATVWQHRLPLHAKCRIGPYGDDGAWLSVGRPVRPHPVAVPNGVAESLSERPSAEREPQFHAPYGVTPEQAERLKADFADWRERTWRPWAAEAKPVIETRLLHGRLQDLRSRIDMNSATEELVWGHGIVTLEVGADHVRYPLVVTPVAVDYDPDQAVVSVAPQGPARLQIDPLAGIEDQNLRQLLALADNGLVTVDLWDDLERRELFERALRRLGHDPVLRAAGEPAVTGPHIHDTSVLFIRPKQRMLRRFMESFRDRLLNGDADGVGALASILAHQPSRLRMPGDQPERWAPVGGRLLMPLPTNEAQESIAQRLSRNRNVAVQGPPGTGKTHTIRNLICHLMAHGKRVLVVAQKEDPLRVLRDGLPDEVKALCLAVLGRSADQLTQLQLAARELSDRAATLDQNRAQRHIDALTAQLEETERELGRALGSLRSIAENDGRTYRIDGALLGPADVGQWLTAREEAYGDIPDAVRDDLPPPLDAGEFDHLIRLATTLTGPDRRQALRALPSAAELPQAGTVRHDRARVTALAAELQALAAEGVHLDAVRDAGTAAFAELSRRLHDAAELLQRREGAWVDRLGRQLTDPRWQQDWQQHVAACQEALTRLSALANDIGGHRVSVPEPQLSQPRQLQADLAVIRQRFAAGKGVSRVFQSSLARLAGECQVDGEPLRTTDDVDVVVAHVTRHQVRAQLAGRWQDWTQWLDIPATDQQGLPEMWAGSLIDQARIAMSWDSQEWPALYATLRRMLPRLEPRADSGTMRAVAGLLNRATAVFEHDRLIEAHQAISAYLQQGMAQADASDLWRVLDLHWQDEGLTGWDDLGGEIRRLAALRPDARTFAQLLARLSAVTPAWAAQIDAGTAVALHGTGADCLFRWRWRQAQTWFDTVVGDLDAELLGRRVERCRERIRQSTRELVVASAWLAVSRALDDRKRAALADWATSLRKIGKGTGKKAAHWQAEAQRQMSAAVDAVPVWVMSIDRAIEQFPDGARFDVIIVDEASQADMFSLPVLSLAERAVVVGDDQQIGPQLSFVGDVQGLIGAHLDDVPSANQFDPEGSLYDHAVRRSERILLTEHFRCVPQIIEFSSINYYEHKIEPLRTDRPAGIGEPVRTVFVSEGVRQPVGSYSSVNVAEAQALITRVEEIVKDPAYDGKTLGVISLLSTSDQGMYLLHELRKRIGEDELERRRLRVGDSYTFQGDERDVVLLSLVASANDGRIAAFTKRDYHRRVNVAASRARDQLWVFHSFQPQDVPADDARGRLLTYCQNIGTTTDSYDDLEKRCDSDFERAVLKRILLQGFRPLPQFKIGSYRIDFVLPLADGRRLAIECDGDAYHGPDQWEADIRRQALLERVGNCVFFRIRGSVFSRDPERTLEPLWQRIDDLGGVAPISAPVTVPAAADTVLTEDTEQPIRDERAPGTADVPDGWH